MAWWPPALLGSLPAAPCWVRPRAAAARGLPRTARPSCCPLGWKGLPAGAGLETRLRVSSLAPEGSERLLLPPHVCAPDWQEQGRDFLTKSLLSKKYSSVMSDNIC